MTKINETNGEIPKDKPKKVPPDGGWGWVIVCAFALANFVLVPILTNFGLIFREKFILMGLTATDVTFIANANLALGMLMGFVTGPLLKTFGYRKISFLAGIIFSTGIILTSFAHSISAFFITYGIVAAVGQGLTTSSFSLALNSYFKVKRNKAAGIAMALTGFGPVLSPPVIAMLISFYGIDGGVLILGGICTHIILASCLLQPIKWHLKDAPVEVTDKELIILNEVKREVESTVEQKPKYELSRQISDYTWDLSSEDEEDYLERPRKHIDIDHDIDVQNIYGCEQIPYMKRPSMTRVDNEENYRSQKDLSKSFYRSESNFARMKNSNMEINENGKKPAAKRWFETGSLDTINLGSSVEIFNEKIGHFDRRESRRSIHHPFSSLKIVEEEQKMLNDLNKSNEIKKPRSIEKLPQQKAPSRLRRVGLWLVTFFDLDLLRDKIYVNIMFGMSIAIFAEFNFSMLTPFILSDLKYSTIEIASLMSFLAISDIISRFLSPFLGDYLKQPPRIMYMISLVLLIITRLSVLMAISYKGMLIVFLFAGAAKGIRTVYMNLVIPNYVPIERLASASGLQMVTNGVFLVCVGPIVGLIRDLTGSYTKCIYFINFITFMALAMWMVEMIYVHRKNNRKVIK